jgi:hypothetical protein
MRGLCVRRKLRLILSSRETRCPLYLPTPRRIVHVLDGTSCPIEEARLKPSETGPSCRSILEIILCTLLMSLRGDHSIREGNGIRMKFPWPWEQL